MSRRRFGLVSAICFASAVIASAAPRASAGDWYVDVNDPNCPTGSGGPNDPFCTIAAAISAAASGDTIHVAAGTYVEQLLIDKSLTLVGTSSAAATIVDGSHAGTVITITAAAVVDLDGLTMTNGSGHYRGQVPSAGGLSIDPSCVVSISDCTVSGNVAIGYAATNSFGGGIYCANATVTILSTTIANNVADEGGGIYNDGGTVTLVDSVVTGNRAGTAGLTAGFGGGIVNYGALHVTRSKITSNYVDFDANFQFYSSAGGIGGNVDGSEVEITDNHGVGFGGGIWGSATLTDSLIEGNDAAAGGGVYGADLTLVRCTIRGNTALGFQSSGFGGSGGGVSVSQGPSTLTDCLIENNLAQSGLSAAGGGATFGDDSAGAIIFERCTIRGNVVNGGPGGGALISNNALLNDTTITLLDCAISGNSATDGGGLWCSSPKNRQTISLLRCTIGGNTASNGGGGVFVDATGKGSVVIGGTIVAVNSVTGGGASPDCDGILVSSGFNCIGDTTGCSVTGDPTGNLLDVDPLYADPSKGDFTLQPTSPCLDTGNPSDRPGGRDAAGHPRLLDGDFDGVMVLDLGAFEFDNVNLAITGNPTPGGTLVFDTEGTAGLSVLMFIGAAEYERFLPRYGSLFIDLASPFLLVPWGTSPNMQSVQIPTSFPVPLTLFFQEFASGVSVRTGNLGNEIRMTIE